MEERIKTHRDYKYNKIFFEVLNRISIGDSYIKNALYHLFMILEPEILNKLIIYLKQLSEGKDEYFKEDGKENWYMVFFKSIRQSDLFQDCFTKRTLKISSDEEVSRYRYLRHKVFADNYKKRDENGKFTDEYREYLKMNTVLNNQTYDESISGHIDMVLHSIMNFDDKDILEKVFESTFFEIDLIEK